MLTTRTMQGRLLRIHATASPTALARADWYRAVAARDCESIARDTGLSFRVVAATMAILSPGPKYAQNLADTRAMAVWASRDRCRTVPPTVCTYGANALKAQTLLIDYVSGADHDADPMPYVSGPKVTAFALNIMGDASHVTLDRHAVRPLNDRTGKAADIPCSREERQRMADAYRKAAAKVGLAPAEFQAVVWVAVRGAAE